MVGSDVELRAELADHGPRSSRRWRVAPILFMTFLAGVILVVTSGPLASLLESLLPGRFQLRSLGTGFDAFGETGSAIIARTGWVLIVSSTVAELAQRRQEWVSDRRIDRALTTTVVLLTAAWYGWLAEPHNAFPTNARIHWVDYLTWDSDDFFYAAGRIPHAVFYDAPWMWQAVNAGLAVLLCYLIARRIGIGPTTATALSTLVAISGNLLVFADTAEDVLLNATLILLLMYASLRRTGWLVGVAIFLLIVGRPSFSILALAIPAAELVIAIRHRHRPHREQIVYVATAAAVAATLVFVSQIYFTIAGRRYFLNQGQLIYVPELADLTPIEVDGFTIGAWSGAYIGHAIWMFPIILLIAAAVATVRAHVQPTAVEATVYLAVMSVVTLVLLVEAKPLLYYNVRYLTYAFPFLIVASWTLLAPGALQASSVNQRTPRREFRALLTALLVLGPLTIPADPIGTKRSIESRAEPELLDIRSELRALTDGTTVYLDFGGRASRNYVAYVLRRNRADVRQLAEGERPDTGVVISRRDDPWSDVDPTLETESLLVIVESG